jgi:hypothetical protein
MCTVVMLRQPAGKWPFLLAANRDEMLSRDWLPPNRHWRDRPNVWGGYDELAKGTWLALNDEGIVSIVLNRKDSLGPQIGKRSRGELPLEAVDHAEARVAAKELSMIEPGSYRSFNLIIADARDAFWLKSLGQPGGKVYVTVIPEGISMITSADLNDLSSVRIINQLPKFKIAEKPRPEEDDWFAWQFLLGARKETLGGLHGVSLNLDNYNGFGTVSSSLIALPKTGLVATKPKWLFAAGRPDETPYISAIT